MLFRGQNHVVALTVSLLCLASLARADTIFVNGDCGDDAWSGYGPACDDANRPRPKRTIQAAINLAADGDIVVLANGTYTAGQPHLNYL